MAPDDGRKELGRGRQKNHRSPRPPSQPRGPLPFLEADRGVSGTQLHHARLKPLFKNHRTLGSPGPYLRDGFRQNLDRTSYILIVSIHFNVDWKNKTSTSKL